MCVLIEGMASRTVSVGRQAFFSIPYCDNLCNALQCKENWLLKLYKIIEEFMDMPPSNDWKDVQIIGIEENTAKLIKAFDECNKSTSTTPIGWVHLRQKIISAIMLGIDYAVGNDTSVLVLKTMKRVYHIDEYTILQKPRLFVDSLVKLVGKSAANSVLSSILKEMHCQNLC